ncbi:thermonuclease family protein [Desulfitobacterium metallireducens]|uniref:Thermonuclease n=1 Tax=Desulfitobacterium metallireducens DSM 15288 TaxID=871968 RepID=W0E938_9FIRM|nr:thermonuclease family protein [Desulfitobacterium metallireducens]AHF07262.1 thermonuclease [Desulfitobacterium metallireducens DSM 15288]
MKKIKRRAAAPLLTLFLAGLLGLGNYGVNVKPDWSGLPKSPNDSPITDNTASQPKPEFQQPESPARQREQETGICIIAYDGDTITVRLTQSPQNPIKVRLIGIDTPELKKGEFGETARDYLKSMVLGQKVRLVYDTDRLDKYGRTLAYVYLQDGTLINACLLEEGYARVMTVPPNIAHAAEFNQLQAEAKEKQKGIWSIPPPKSTWREEKIVQDWKF